MADIVLTIDPDDTSFALHDRANGRRVLGFDAPVPETDSQWASSADTEGARRANLRYPNRVITAQVMLDRSTDALLQALENTLGQKIGKLAREGGELRFTYPSGTAITFNVLEASMQRMFDPAEMFKVRARYELTFICEPFGLGTETDLGDNTETTLPCLVFTEASIPGDVPALGRLVIDNDEAATDIGFLVWGVQSRYYSAAADAALFYESESCSISGAGGALAAGPAGASGGGSNVVRHSNFGSGGTSDLAHYVGTSSLTQTHIGTFRVFARVQAPTSNTDLVKILVNWAPSSNVPRVENPAVTLADTAGAALEGAWYIVDLGLISIPKAVVGSQGWVGWLWTTSSNAANTTDDVDFDWVALVPVDEGYGELGGNTSAPWAVNRSSSAEIRHDGAFSEHATNGRYGKFRYKGDYMLIPPSGAENRTARIIIIPMNGVTSTLPTGVYSATTIFDISARLFVTPRYYVIPT